MSHPKLSEEILQRIRQHFQAVDDVRRGICLLNAGRYQEAEVAFSRAMVAGHNVSSLPSYLAACALGRGRATDAARHFQAAAQREATNVSPRVRHAMSLWVGGDREGAVDALRTALREHPENAELHFQLGLQLSEQERYDEAERCFQQAVTYDPRHSEALISLAMCCAIRHEAYEAITHLKQAQSLRPHDPRIGLFLAQAARALTFRGERVHIRAAMPEEDACMDRDGIEELSRIIATDSEFVDAFLAIRAQAVDERVYRMLLRTIELALERQPEHAELHCHCGEVLERLGRPDEAIGAHERAVGINPRSTRALIALARLYQQTDRTADATARLEQAIAAGAEYADVYCLLGNLYRDQGLMQRAKAAYGRAIQINRSYTEAREALQALSA